MSEIATIILPYIGLIACGFITARIVADGSNAVAALNLVAFYFVLPAWLFRAVATAPEGALPGWSFLLTTTFATYCAFALAFSFGALINRGKVPEATIQGLIGAFGNTGFLAPALIVAVLGQNAAGPAALIVMFDTVLLLVLGPAMMALGGAEKSHGAAMARRTIRRIALHPLVLAVLAGWLARAFDLLAPGLVGAVWPVLAWADALLAFLSDAAPTVALVAVGAGIAGRSVGGTDAETPIALLVKLVVHPVIVYLLLTWIGGFDPVWIGAAVLAAAMPPAATVFGLARQYGIYVSETSRALLYGTVASVVTITGIISILLPAIT